MSRHHPAGFATAPYDARDIIPHFAKNGTALTQEERAAIAKRKGLCVGCGIRTHNIPAFSKVAIDNDYVRNGICINCNPMGTTTRLESGEGCLFACSAQQSANPTLTLVDTNTNTNTSDTAINSSYDPFPAPAPGDDLSPPNAVEASKMNGIAVPVSASAGWSQSPPKKEGVYPSCVAYDLRLCTNNQNKDNGKSNSNNGSTAISDSLELAVSLEYSNPRFEEGESMMVKVAVAKTMVNAELGTELALIATQFQEWVPDKNNWVDITADVDYTETANAVVDAVMQDPNSGQTAGKATVTAKTVELTLGPFSAKARLNLTFQADKLYTYEAMSMQADAADIGSHRLLPLWVNLPFAPVDHEAGLSNLAVRMQAPPGTSVLPIDQYREAYQDLKKQDIMETTTILALSDLTPQPQLRTVGYQFQWESLPPRSTGILAWLALPNPVEDIDSFDFVHIGQTLEEVTNGGNTVNKTKAQATIQVPLAEDRASLQVPLPGHGPMGNLFRLKVKMPEAQPRQQPYFVLNLTLSDKSGSTGRRVLSGMNSVTMRQRFNELAEVRFLKRLESIPALVQAGVLRMDDVWMDVFLAFDSSAPASAIHRVCFRVGDVHDHIVQVVQDIRSNGALNTPSLLPAILGHVQALFGVKPGGLTDFSIGPRTLVQSYAQWKSEARGLLPAGCTVAPCTFVEFDTDGGHNGVGDYLLSLRSFCEVYDVRNGVVTGFGSWLNQDCASKVANILGSVPAMLALHVPESGSEGLDKVFRTGFSAWIGALRQPPKMTLKVSAGSVSFPSGASSRNANAVEVLALRRVGERHQGMPKFGPPDVSDETYTKAVLADVPAGDELLLYIVSRLDDASQLARALEIQTSAGGSSPGSVTECKAHVWNEEEGKSGNYLAYDWLKMLTRRPGADALQLAPLMATSLASRLEDEVSFRFNIASPSGKTSFLGRCKTVANRASIDAAHQPDSPNCPIKIGALKPKPKPKPTTLSQGAGSPAFRSSVQRQRLACLAAPAPNRAPPPSFYAGADMAKHGISLNCFDDADEITRSVGSSARFAPQSSEPLQMAAPRMSSAIHDPSAGASRMASAPLNAASRSSAPLQMASPWISSATGGPSARRGASAPLAASLANRSKAQKQSAAQKQLTPHKPTDPSWIDTLEVPVGSDTPLAKQDYVDLLQAMNEVAHARRRLLGDPSVNFLCDVCNRQIANGEARYHCYDCQDFDLCANCQTRHTVPFHRVALINSTFQHTNDTVAVEDPLVGSLLGTNLPSSSSTGATALGQFPPKVDQTVEWCKLRISRFLLAVMHWWPLFRATCSFRDQLPSDISDELAQRIANCFNSGDINEQMATFTVIMDSLMREAQNASQAVGDGF